MSCYAPAWVKTNQRVSPLTRQPEGSGDTPPLAKRTRTLTRVRLRRLCALREVDAENNTVIMVQVENEIGMIPDSRDRSAIADKLFNQLVPGS